MVRRNVSIDQGSDEWLRRNDINASELVRTLVQSYRAHGGDEMEAVRYTLEKRLHETADSVANQR